VIFDGVICPRARLAAVFDIHKQFARKYYVGVKVGSAGSAVESSKICYVK